jgi:hypothetical protein
LRAHLGGKRARRVARSSAVARVDLRRERLDLGCEARASAHAGDAGEEVAELLGRAESMHWPHLAEINRWVLG